MKFVYYYKDAEMLPCFLHNFTAFSNQNSGGTFAFGLDEKSGFAKVGVYDAQDIERKVMEYCEQMEKLLLWLPSYGLGFTLRRFIPS